MTAISLGEADDQQRDDTGAAPARGIIHDRFPL
jgi:hypothetical protein